MVLYLFVRSIAKHCSVLIINNKHGHVSNTIGMMMDEIK